VTDPTPEHRAPVSAVVVTYRRPEGLADSVRALAAQTHAVDRLVVVDNDGGLEPSVVDALGDVPFDVEIVRPPRNIGPAGGFATGIDVLTERDPDVWVLLLDDDDPLRRPDVIERLLARRDELLAQGIRLGGIGMNGARFDPRFARTSPMPFDGRGLQEVDHLHGGYAPLYSGRAVQEAGNFREELFWGFEELELGLRLNDAGWRMFMDGDLLHECGWTDKLAAVYSRPKVLVSDDSPERRYYKLRNLYVISTERAHGLVPRLVLFARGFVKPVVSLPLRPRLAGGMLRWNRRARRDAVAGRLGRTVPL
jgi:glycosyltransferase involved in cell wall biosynthesis